MSEDLVATTNGILRGEVDGELVFFRGVPFARPPVGELRFLAPVALSPWDGVRDARSYGPSAMQEAVSIARDTMSEDCLYLNITAPKDVSEPSAVLVWLHGGGFRTGSGTHTFGDAREFARRHHIVVVTINYRLGPFGFLYLGDVLGERYGESGNVGLLDQIAALKWVQANIAEFGGDPTRVTLVGASAGAKAAATLMASPLTNGLFARVTSLSGGADHVMTRDQASAQAALLLNAAGIEPSQGSRLFDIAPEQLVQFETKLGSGSRAVWTWRPVIDDVVLFDRPNNVIEAGGAEGIDVLAGTVVDEGALYIASEPSILGYAPGILKEIFGADGSLRMLDIYRRQIGSTNDAEVYRAFLGDERYGIPTIRLLDAQGSHGTVWRYRFDARPEYLGRLAGGHATDHEFFFCGRGPTQDVVWSDLANTMTDALAAFVNFGDPSTPKLGAFSAYDVNDRWTMIFDARSQLRSDPGREVRKAWEGVVWSSGTWWPVGEEIRAGA